MADAAQRCPACPSWPWPQRQSSGSSPPARPPGRAHAGIPWRADSKPLTRSERRNIVIQVGIKLVLLLLLSIGFLVFMLRVCLPPLAPEDRDRLRIPRSFEGLMTLNVLVKKYRHQYGGRLLLSWTSVYLFLQAFAVPGSMYLSILAGAIWGPTLAYPLVICVRILFGAFCGDVGSLCSCSYS